MRNHPIFFLLFFLVVIGLSNTANSQEIIEGITDSTTSRIYYTEDSIFSPSDTSNHVSFSKDAKVEYISKKAVWLDANFEASDFNSGGYFKAFFPMQVYLEAEQGCNDGSGTISATVFGGKSPYSYSWSTSATTSSIGYSSQGDYRVTITDSRGIADSASITISSDVLSDIIWGTSVGVDTSGDTIRKVYETGWGNGGSVSQQKLDVDEDGIVEYRITEGDFFDNINYRRYLGFSVDTNYNANYSKIDYAFYFNKDSVGIREDGIAINSNTGYRIGDVFRIERQGDTIRYIHNDDTLREVVNATVSEKQLMADISIFNENAYFYGLKVSFCPITMLIAGSTSEYTEDSLRYLTAVVTEGMPPYSYNWSTGATTQSIQAWTGNFTVTVTDDWSSTTVQSLDVVESILWTDLDSCSVSSDTLWSTGSAANWSSGAASRNILQSNADGYILYTIADTLNNNKERYLGLSDANDNYGTDSIKSAIKS